MRLWGKIKIKGKTWKIIFQRSINDEGIPCVGLCDYGTRTIRIGRNKMDRMGGVIMLHELLHALGSAHDFNLRDSDKERGEAQIDRIAFALYFLNQENPRFWEKMKEIK